jgi:Transglycosylase SLT domain
MSVPFVACMAAAASFYHLPPRVLPAIQAVEGGRPGLIQPNTNGTADLGLMQINSIWIEPLARFANMPPQAVAYRLVDDPCFNIAIMRAYLSEAQGNLMIAIGFYHSHTPGFGAIYQQKVLGAAATLFSGKRHKTR